MSLLSDWSAFEDPLDPSEPPPAPWAVQGTLGPGPTIRLGALWWGITDTADTDWICENLDGWADMPESNAPAYDRTFDHGAWSGPGWFKARPLVLTGVVVAQSRWDLQRALNAIRGEQARALDDPVVLEVDELDGTKHLDVRAGNPHLTVEYLNPTSARVVSELFAPWPVKEAAHRDDITHGVQRGVGWRYPRLQGKRVYQSPGFTGDLVVENDGNAPTRPRFLIRGPCSNPSIISATLGRRITFNLSLIAADQLVIDVDTHSILLNTVANRRYALSPDSAWFYLQPGRNIIQYRAGSGTGSLTMTWASGWW